MAIYDDCIMFNLAKAYQRVHSEFKRRFSKFGLTPIQLLVLEALFEEEGLSSGEIGKRLVVTEHRAPSPSSSSAHPHGSNFNRKLLLVFLLLSNQNEFPS